MVWPSITVVEDFYWLHAENGQLNRALPAELAQCDTEEELELPPPHGPYVVLEEVPNRARIAADLFAYSVSLNSHIAPGTRPG